MTVRVTALVLVDLKDLQSSNKRGRDQRRFGSHVCGDREADAEINGAGSIRYYGSPQLARIFRGLATIRSLGDN